MAQLKYHIVKRRSQLVSVARDLLHIDQEEIPFLEQHKYQHCSAQDHLVCFFDMAGASQQSLQTIFRGFVLTEHPHFSANSKRKAHANFLGNGLDHRSAMTDSYLGYTQSFPKVSFSMARVISRTDRSHILELYTDPNHHLSTYAINENLLVVSKVKFDALNRASRTLEQESLVFNFDGLYRTEFFLRVLNLMHALKQTHAVSNTKPPPLGLETVVLPDDGTTFRNLGNASTRDRNTRDIITADDNTEGLSLVDPALEGSVVPLRRSRSPSELELVWSPHGDKRPRNM